jgi:hypothetical protein
VDVSLKMTPCQEKCPIYPHPRSVARAAVMAGPHRLPLKVMANYARIYRRPLANERSRPARSKCRKALQHGEALVGVVVLRAEGAILQRRVEASCSCRRKEDRSSWRPLSTNIMSSAPSHGNGGSVAGASQGAREQHCQADMGE